MNCNHGLVIIHKKQQLLQQAQQLLQLMVVQYQQEIESLWKLVMSLRACPLTKALSVYQSVALKEK